MHPFVQNVPPLVQLCPVPSPSPTGSSLGPTSPGQNVFQSTSIPVAAAPLIWGLPWRVQCPGPVLALRDTPYSHIGYGAAVVCFSFRISVSRETLVHGLMVCPAAAWCPCIPVPLHPSVPAFLQSLCPFPQLQAASPAWLQPCAASSLVPHSPSTRHLSQLKAEFH